MKFAMVLLLGVSVWAQTPKQPARHMRLVRMELVDLPPSSDVYIFKIGTKLLDFAYYAEGPTGCNAQITMTNPMHVDTKGFLSFCVRPRPYRFQVVKLNK